MPVEVGFWNIKEGRAKRVSFSSIESEKKLETVLAKSVEIIGDDLMLLGRQVRTAQGNLIDLLGINGDGKVTIIELKKAKTPRDVVAQALDYASWVQTLSYNDLKSLYENFAQGKTFEAEFSSFFGTEPPEKINQEHDMLIVCAELDAETERIINYLSTNYNVPINAVFFRYFEDGQQEYLSRSWLIDPAKVATIREAEGKSEQWNGRDFVVNIDSFNEISSWPDCVKFGFTSAGGGKWYSRTLEQLFVGARVFAMIPSKGYVGVGEVIEEAMPIKDFRVELDGKRMPILDVPLVCDGLKRNPDDLDTCEWFVRIKWSTTHPENAAFWEKGMRANQNSAFKLRNRFTLEKLTTFFGIADD